MSSTVLVGGGGWQYFIVPGKDRLHTYSLAFDFVEVNSSFYRKIPLSQATSWRRRVRPGFIFTVKCHQAVTHVHRLQPTDSAVDAFNHSIKICKTLNAPLLVVETPPTLKLTPFIVKQFFSSVRTEGVRVGLEIRGPVSSDVLTAMQDLNIIHVTDLSRETPKYFDEEITYSRLFGKGVHNMYMFDDDEIREISRKADESSSKKVLLSFHGLRMYVDAARIKVFREKGVMAPVTRETGIDSVKAALADAVFPATKHELETRHGWKLFDLTVETRVRLASILSNIPDQTYTSLDNLLETIKLQLLTTR
ncbi:MAG: DUF72 domain-containing protein [Candidatus Caldarchaeum sp.]